MITVTVAGLDTMSSDGVKRVAGLFNVIAEYHASFEHALPSLDFADQMPEPTHNFDEDPVVIEPVVYKTASGIEIDSSGLPWDGRIHSSGRAKVTDGTWRLRRGVDESVINAVNRELSITMGLTPTAPVAEPSPLMPPSITPPFVNSVEPLAPPASTIFQQELVGVATTVSHSEPAIAQIPMTFTTLIQLITSKYAAKELDQVSVQAAVAAAGLPSLPMLNSRPDLVSTVAIALGLL